MLLPSSARATLVTVLDPNVRSRPVVSGGTLRTDTGQIIRAARVHAGSTVAESSLAWERCRALGINCMRVGITGSISTALAKAARVVDAARNNRCYVMLGNPATSPGSWGDNIATNKANSIAFWSQMAPRFKDEAHVFYEMCNEPERLGTYTNYTSTAGVPTALTVALREVFEVMRAAAPDTVLLAPSTPNIDAAGGVSQYIKAIQAWESLGPVDWTKACWAFHNYNRTHKMGVTSKTGGADSILAPDLGRAALAWLRDRYPILGTEGNWWVEASRPNLIDFPDAMEDVQVGYTIMAYPQETPAAHFLETPELWPVPLDNKIAQLRSRGFIIPVE